MIRNKVICENCTATISSSNYAKHIESKQCRVNKEKGLPVKSFIAEDLTCRFCDTQLKNKNSFINHERTCSDNPNRQLTYFSTDKDVVKKSRKIVNNQYTKADQLGLPKPLMSTVTRKKLSDSNLARSEEWNKENGRKISEVINKKVANGTWHTSLAKDMHYSYKGNDLHGSWELRYAMYLDSMGIKWCRNKESFPYEFQGIVRRYTPDFYLSETNEYIEIKGYKTAKDESKWSQFPADKKLKVLFGKDLKSINII